jgi:type I restriction enzyme, S subunit
MSIAPKVYSIQELCVNIVGGGTPSTKISSYWNGNIPWISSADISESGQISVSRFITSEAIQNSATNIVPKGTVLIVSRVGVGKAAIAPFDLCFSQDCQGLILKSELVNEEFFLRAIQTSLKALTRKARGATITGVTKEEIKKLAIPIPNIEDQIRIANILRKAQELINQRKETLRLLDEFLKSTFLDMFGDPIKNAKGWEESKLADILTDIKAGWSPVCEDRPRENENDIAILKLSAVTYGYFNPSANKKLKPGTEIRKSIEPKGSDILFTRKNTLDLVGATAYVFRDYPNLFLSDTIFKLEYNKSKVDGLFLWKLLSHKGVRNSLQKLATGSAGSMPNISQERLLSFNTILPPLMLQTEFAHIVQKTELLKAEYQRSLEELENLYESLSQRSFKGELKPSA